MTSSLLLQNLLKSPDQPSCKTCHSIEKRPSHGQRNLASYSLSGSQRVGHHLASERWPLLVCSLSLLRTYACILSSLICHSIFFLQILHITNQITKSPIWCSCSVTQPCLNLWDSMDFSLPGSSVHGISQARILEWVSISSSRESSWPRDRTQVSCIDR